MPAGSVLWEHASWSILRSPSVSVARGMEGAAVQRVAAEGAAAEAVVVRGCHLSTLQQRLVTLRESLAREHAQLLAGEGKGQG